MGIINTILKGISSNTVTINGNTYHGKTVTIKDGKVIVDGKEVECKEKEIHISVTGDVDTIETASGDVEVSGDVNILSTTSGDVVVHGSVNGNVDAVSGDVDVGGDIHGKVTTVSGNVSA